MVTAFKALFVCVAGCGTVDPGSAAPAASDAAVAVSVAERLGVQQIAIFQGVKVTLVDAGNSVRAAAPIVAGRPALVRVYVAPSAERKWQPRKLKATLEWSVAGAPPVTYAEVKTLRQVSSDSALDSTFNFEVDADSVQPNSTLSVVVSDEVEPSATSLRFPEDGVVPVAAQAGTEELKIKLVPVRYTAGGVDRLPEFGPEQIRRYHDTLFKMYPTAKVTIDVREPLAWDQVLGADGTGWDELLLSVADLRVKDRSADDVYYVGAIAPERSLGYFCDSGACVLGLAPLAGPNEVDARIAMVVGYAGQRAANTLTQELAHAMGREHAACGGADRPDPKFPYAQAGVGVWGYDLVEKALVDPDTRYDFMGYCDPIWVSDYTYAALFKRLAQVRRTAGASASAPPQGGQKLRVVHVDANGRLRWGRSVTLRTALGDAVDVTTLGVEGAREIRGHLVRFDHRADRVLLLPDAAPTVKTIRIHGVHASAMPVMLPD